MAANLTKRKPRKQVKYYETNAAELCDYLGIEHDTVEQLQFHAPLSKNKNCFVMIMKTILLFMVGK